MSTATATTGLRKFGGFFAGLAIVVVSGWVLLYAGYILADRAGFSERIGLAIAAALSLVLFLLLERNFWLSRLMGLHVRPNASPVASAVSLWLLGGAWLFIKSSFIDADRPDEEAAEEKKKHPPVPRDHTREAVETIVFVVVLVLLLKLFVTEAFVIPTGSMAETLYGYQKIVTCPKCGHEFPVNSHDEVEPNQVTGRKHQLVGYTCPNCRYHGKTADLNPVPTNRTGDRVLVLKPIYHLTAPQRGDVVVFKYPEAPQQLQTAQNYIKRAMGFGRETVGIFRGELFFTTSLEYPADAKDENGQLLYPRPDDEKDLWRPKYMYADSRQALERFDISRKAGFPDDPGSFRIVRKIESQLLADLRIVWDNDKQPKELAGVVPARWFAQSGTESKWTGDNPHQPRAFAHTDGEQHWIRYRHLVGGWNGEKVEPRPIDNFLGYNAGVEFDPFTQQTTGRAGYYEDAWVGDLCVECETDVSDGGEVTLELSKGVNRFQARFADGKVTLTSTGPGAKEFGSRETRGGRPGKHTLRFANIDCRLWVWVDGKRIDFGTDADYPPTKPEDEKDAEGSGWTKANDVDAPAGVGAKGRVTVRSIKLHRDIFYTGGTGSKPDVYYIQPGHHMCLGDNSAQSSDSRKWGTVPERLMLGKAVFVFFPVSLDAAKNRVGFIK